MYINKYDPSISFIIEINLTLSSLPSSTLIRKLFIIDEVEEECEQKKQQRYSLFKGSLH